ncbi:MAG TPA: diacylglycerol kinase family protein [Verrucomicrobiae bacterium]
MRRICVIFNPAARGEKAARFRQHLAELSEQCTLKATFAPGAGRILGAEAAREGFEIIVAAGGDGTVNEVLNGIGDVEGAFGRCTFGILPLGTINVFAKEIKMPTGFAEAWNIIRAGREYAIDLPWAEFTHEGQPHRRYFAQMAGAGLDSRAIDFVDLEQKKRIGGAAYIVAGLKAMRGKMPQVVVTDGTKTLTGELVLIGNGRFYGGKFPIFPLADLQDGVLEVSVFPRVDWIGFIRCGWGLLTNQLYSSGGAQHMRAGSIQVSSTDRMPFQVEGENAGILPARFSLTQKGLKVIVP